MVIAGLIVLLLALTCFVLYRNAKAKVGEVLHTQTSSIADIAERAGAVHQALGQGYSSDYTEIKGEVEAPQTLISPMGEKECVYFHATVEREWEKEETYRDDAGKRHTRTVTGRDTVSTQSDWVPFYVNDGSGTLRVDPKDSDIDLVESLSYFEPASSGAHRRGRLNIGSFSLDIDTDSSWGRQRLVGYHFNERIFKSEGQAYLLGTVVDRKGELTLVHPAEKEQRYIISHKSEEQIVTELDSQTKWYFWIAVVAGVLGVALNLVGLVTGMTGFD